MGRNYSVYFVRCSDGSLYIGTTNNRFARIRRHNEYKGSWWIKQHGGGHIVYHEDYNTLLGASRREQQLKKWSRAKKEALIKSELKLLKRL